MKPLRLAILISGSGTTMQSVFEAVREKRLSQIEPVMVISSDARAKGVEKATQAGIKTAVVERKKFGTRDEFGEGILKELNAAGAELVAQLGWLPLTPPNVIQRFEGSIFNQHPGPLDPGCEDFGGKGMFGIHVFAALLAYQWLTGDHFPTEATTHFVTEEFDKGEVISVAKLETPEHEQVGREYFDTDEHLQELAQAAEALQKQLLPLEHKNVLYTLELLANKPVVPVHHTNRLIPEKNTDMLVYAKRLAALI